MSEISTPTEPALISPTPNASIGEKTSQLNWIPYLSSVTVLSVAGAYLVGFIVVNSALFKYGMVPYDFLQPRYISAGLLYLASTVGFSSAVAFLIHLARNKHFLGDLASGEIKSAWIIILTLFTLISTLSWLFPKSENIEWWRKPLGIVSIVLAWVVASLNTEMLPMTARFPKLATWWRTNIWEGRRLSKIVLGLMLLYMISTYGETFVFYVAFIGGISLLIAVIQTNPNQELGVSWNTYGLFLAILALCFSVYTYGTFTYPLISPHIGGGKPLLISIAIKRDTKQIIGRMMGREDWKCVMHNIFLIHENSELIYVLPKGYLADVSAVAIPKSELLSIVYQRVIKQEHATCLENEHA